MSLMLATIWSFVIPGNAAQKYTVSTGAPAVKSATKSATSTGVPYTK